MTARSGSPPQRGQLPRFHAGEVASRHHRVARARQERAHRLLEHRLEACELRADGAGAGPHGFVPRADDARQTFGLAREVFRPLVIGVLERLVVAHRRRGRAQQEPQVAPIDRQVLELQDGPVGEQSLQVLGLEPDGWQRHAGLDAALHLKQLDLQVGGG